MTAGSEIDLRDYVRATNRLAVTYQRWCADHGVNPCGPTEAVIAAVSALVGCEEGYSSSPLEQARFDDLRESLEDVRRLQTRIALLHGGAAHD